MCYVQCTKDNPHSGGISAAHLRRSSTSSQIRPLPLKSCSEQGFTKKVSLMILETSITFFFSFKSVLKGNIFSKLR